jgi:cyclopropane-fatty-acyl-phospholipid synthase
MLSGIEMAERGYLPDLLLRTGVRQLLGARIRWESQQGPSGLNESHRQLVSQLRQSPLAIETRSANQQHYEVPAAYFETVLGPHLKYSSCLWPAGVSELRKAEEAMLDLTCAHAGLDDGMEVLELGCGWGSLALWMAERYPNSRILAISNSASQRQFIESKAHKHGLKNVQIQTADINHFVTDRKFDRVVSVEMLEHLRNYELLFNRVSIWLKPTGKFFVHVFYHNRCAYPFELDGNNDWMAKHFQRDLLIDDRWLISGRHYQKTLESWLVRHDANRDRILEMFEATYGAEMARVMFYRWRIFYVACAELFGFRRGDEWGIAHFLFRNRH